MLYAMKHSVPVISLLGETTEDLVLPLQSALATNYGARDEFARWAKYVIEVPEAAVKIGAQGKRHVENMFRDQAAPDAYARLYDELARTA